MKFNSLKGVQDIFPSEIYIWQKIENISREVFGKYGYHEIRLPIIESTDIFTRSIGKTTDIVEKEMYTFNDKGGRSITLRPEGTASFVRAYVQNHLYNKPSPQKYYYMGPMFRYENPQSERYRQFYQIGVEALGTDNPQLDTEIISMLWVILKNSGMKKPSIEVSSIGCFECRPEFRSIFKKTIKDKLNVFCNDCQRRYKSNPLRILDCKVSSCIKARRGSPSIIDYLCNKCKTHFDKLKHNLELLGVPFTVNPNIVRGLDYYTRTAFEVTSEDLGSQNAVAAGGRYDGLVQEFGGPSVSGIGFAIGVERLASILEDNSGENTGPELYFCTLGQDASEEGFLLTEQLRGLGIWTETNHDASSLKSQMRKADRIGSRHVMILGEDELKKGTATIRDMHNKKETNVSIKANDILKVLNKKD